ASFAIGRGECDGALAEQRAQCISATAQPLRPASSDGLAAVDDLIDLQRLRKGTHDLAFGRHKAVSPCPGQLAHRALIAITVCRRTALRWSGVIRRPGEVAVRHGRLQLSTESRSSCW